MTELITGLTLGLGAGVAPGPLQTLVVTSTLERGFGAGWRVALAPLYTDTPIVLISVLAVSTLPVRFVNGLAVVGGIVLVGMGFWIVARTRPVEIDEEESAGLSDTWRGIAVNLASPHPWVFWVTAGAPIVVTAWRRSVAEAVAFLAGFYVLLIGTKVAIAWAVARARTHLSPHWRWRLVVIGGGLLVAGGILLVWQGLTDRFG